MTKTSGKFYNLPVCSRSFLDCNIILSSPCNSNFIYLLILSSTHLGFLERELSKAGLFVEGERLPGMGVKLHATFLNTKHRRTALDTAAETGAALAAAVGNRAAGQLPKEAKPGRAPRVPCDVGPILAEEGLRGFGAVRISQLHLSRMSSNWDHLRPAPSTPPEPIFAFPHSDSRAGDASASADSQSYPLLPNYYACISRIIL